MNSSTASLIYPKVSRQDGHRSDGRPRHLVAQITKQNCQFLQRALTTNILKTFSKHVSCEFEIFRVNTHICKLCDISNFANTMNGVKLTHGMHEMCGSKCGELKPYFSFDIIPTTTAIMGSLRNKIIQVLVKPKSTNNLSLSTPSIHSSSKYYYFICHATMRSVVANHKIDGEMIQLSQRVNVPNNESNNTNDYETLDVRPCQPDPTTSSH